MAANPKIAPHVDPAFEKRTMQICEPKPVGLKQRVRNLLTEIFKGHNEFLGWTQD